ncbi:hypothetical protein [Cupriavidus necator]|uniref:hypothetical protein n=1 Tax=Cupriavidus necator TaxID=106590 RepID=UPI00148F9FEF|nr:hypothetical protein [Cupriavidus necator]
MAHLANALAFALHVIFASNCTGVRRSPEGDWQGEEQAWRFHFQLRLLLYVR